MQSFPDELGEITAERIAGWVAEIDAGNARSADDIRDDIFKYVVGRDAIMDVLGVDAATADALILGGNDGGQNFSDLEVDEDGNIVTSKEKVTPEGGEGFPGLMAGGTIHLVDNGDQPDYYIVAYEWPPGSGHSFFYTFDSKEALEAFTGPDFGGIQQGGDIVEKALSDPKLFTNGGDSNEIADIDGSFNSYMDDIVTKTLTLAGINDPTRLGAALKDPSIQLLIAQAVEGDIDTDSPQFLAMLRDNDYYKNVVYPGIENFYGMTDNPEAAYAMYKQNVETTFKAMGIEKDADGSYDSTLARMLDAGISDTEFTKFAPTYLRATNNQGYMDSLNKWLAAAGVPILENFDDLFDVLAGTAPPDVAQVVELANASYVASNAGFSVGDAMIQEIADRTDLTEAELAQAFSTSDRDLLALGPAGLRTLGITQEDVISTAAGYTRGTRSIEEMKSQIAKAKKEQGIQDDPTATIFTDFNREGAPVKKGLQSTISEGA